MSSKFQVIHKIVLFLFTFLTGVYVGDYFHSGESSLVEHALPSGDMALGGEIPSVSLSSNEMCPKQVYDFISELKCRSEGHMGIPKILLSDGTGKVVVDIGLDEGLEFFAAINSSYSVFGFEANPITAERLRVKCEVLGVERCEYVDLEKATFPLKPKHKGGYLIGAGLGSKDGYVNLTLNGPGSSMVETSPGGKTDVRTIRILKLEDIVDTDVFFYKLDVQGMEFEVLKGSKGLFQKHKVKTMLMEVYPRGLGHAGVNFEEFLNYIYEDIGMFCSTAGGKFGNHPNSIKEFASILEQKSQPVWWGTFDDVFCFNVQKTWNNRRLLTHDMKRLVNALL